jgi:hypothetical protein
VMRQNTGSHLDPRLMEIFLSIMPEILNIKAAWTP